MEFLGLSMSATVSEARGSYTYDDKRAIHACLCQFGLKYIACVPNQLYTRAQVHQLLRDEAVPDGVYFRPVGGEAP